MNNNIFRFTWTEEVLQETMGSVQNDGFMLWPFYIEYPKHLGEKMKIAKQTIKSSHGSWVLFMFISRRL